MLQSKQIIASLLSMLTKQNFTSSNKVVPMLTQPCADSCDNSIESAQPIAKHWKDFKFKDKLLHNYFHLAWPGLAWADQGK